MATTIVTARPAQTLRQRRETQRPGIARVNTRATTAEAADSLAPSIPTPYVPTPEYILKKFNGKPPSLILHLHPTHFRFDQQDGSFTYGSPFKAILEHLKAGAVPHMIIEELFAANVPWYDGCLIVEVHDHKTGARSTPSNATNQVGGQSNIPFSVHNYNEHITPSPYVPFPADKLKLSPTFRQTSSTAINAPSGEKDLDKENMPAPDQPASASKKQAKGPRITTIVLFPTPLSFEEEKNILARTPIADVRSTKRILQTNSRDGATPTMGQPPTPLASVPPTPLTSKSNLRKPKMALDETNVHDFEAEVLRVTNPRLYLEPAKDADESFAILHALQDPLYSDRPSGPKSRKRTVAELAADEAQAANEERFMLSLDERHQQSVAAGGVAASDAQAGAASFEPSFKRFKTLENIKIKHAEVEREKKETAAREAHMKRQQSAADEMKRQELEKRQAEAQKVAQEQQARAELMKRTALKQQQQQQQQLQQQQQHQQQQQQQSQQQQPPPPPQTQATPTTSHPQHMQNMVPTTTQAQLQQVQQASHASPVLRQQSQTPMNSSPMLNGHVMTSIGVTSLPMAATASNQGAGSPARPPTAMSQHPAGMARQVSQQHHLGSGHGTPQMHSTPSIGSAVPVTRNMTPQPRGITQHGSPMGGVQSTPMIGTPSNGLQLTPEQQQQAAAAAALYRAGQMRMMQQQQHQHQQQQQQLQQQQQQQHNIRGSAASQMSPQQMQIMTAQAQQRQQQQQQMGMATPAQQNAQHMMNRQAIFQQLQMQQGGVQQASPSNMMAMPNQVIGQGMQPTDPISAQVDALRRQAFQKFTTDSKMREQRFIVQHGGNPDAIPLHLKQQFQADEQRRFSQYGAQVNLAANQKLNQLRTQQQTTQQQMMMRQQSGMNQGGGSMMQNVPGQIGGNMMGAAGPAVNPSTQQQYQQLMNAERQKILMEQRAAAAGNMMGPGQAMQGMNMNSMNMQGMNPAMQQSVMNNPQLMQQMRMQQQMGQMAPMGMQGMPGQGM